MTGQDAGTTNELWVALAGDIVFESKGSTWTSGAKTVALDLGLYWAYIISTNASGEAVSNLVRLVVTDVTDTSGNIPFVKKNLKQTAVYWPKESDDEYGAPTWADPMEIKCRWENTDDEFINTQGTTEKAKAKIYADRDLTLGGVLLLGTLDQVTDYASPKDNDGAWEIKSVGRLPNLKGTKFLRTVYI